MKDKIIKWWNGFKSSRTLMFNMFLLFLGVLEVNMGLLQGMLGDYYGVVLIAVATINGWLRLITTQAVGAKNE